MIQLTCDNVLLICLQFVKMTLVRIGESLREVGRSLETDYVCVSASVYVQHASAVNCRGFPWQLTAASFIFPWQLTTEGHFRLLHVFLSQTKCVNNKFHDTIETNMSRNTSNQIVMSTQKFANTSAH